MSYHHSRRLLTPGTSSRKRKEMEALYTPTSAKTFVQPAAAVSGTKFATTTSSRSAPLSSNRLFAGYMAYEFLTKGTLFGQIFDPARAEPNSAAADHHQYKIRNNKLQSSAEAEPSVKVKPKSNGYAEVAWLMKSEGAHIPGVVNPTQLAGWIDQM